MEPPINRSSYFVVESPKLNYQDCSFVLFGTEHQKLPQNLFLNDAGQDLAVADHKDELCLLKILLQDFKNRCSIMHFEMF